MQAEPKLPLTIRAISLASLCTTYGALPRPGGVLDQDALDMVAMTIVREIQEEFRKHEREKEARNGTNKSGRASRPPG